MNKLETLQQPSDTTLLTERARKLASVFRTPRKEEPEINKELGDRPYAYVIGSSDQRIAVHGTRHTTHLGTETDALKTTIDSERPDLVLVEGAAWERALERSDIDSAAVLSEYGEQGYAAVYAHQKGIRVEGWDTQKESLLVAASEESPETLLTWCVLQTTKLFRENQKELNVARIIEHVTTLLGVENLPASFHQANPNALQTWDNLITERTGKPLSELSLAELEQFVSPRFEGPTNRLARKAGELRDLHAMKKILAALKTHKRIVVTTGRSHAITWEPAVQQIFTQETPVQD